ncbi:MAG: hypothetical protein DMF78_00750 [Acidobacteria bacterium]|nr:MAG: hypothetical protein DMF78_00750 [Acidobacteriota bacterium]
MAPSPPPLPFGAGERLRLRMTYAHLLSGRAEIAVLPAEHEGRRVLRLSLDVRSEGIFAWLFRYRVDDHTVATWDPATGCSYGIEKHLREGRAVRDQVVRIDPVAGMAYVEDAKIPQHVFAVGPCALDVFSAFFVARQRGLAQDGSLSVRVFDNGKLYDLPFKHVGYERLDLPPPLGRAVLTQVAEPVVPPGSGLFTQEGRLLVWVTADARRIPVRVRSKVPVGSVGGDLESYTPPGGS